MGAIIRTESVWKIYQQGMIRVEALKGVSLTVEEGEFTAIVGPSGSGKTTLLNLLGGLDRPEQGRVWLNGMEISRMRSGALSRFRLHHIGFVFQAYNLIPVLTALENAAFVLELRGLPTRERAEQARTALAELEMEGYADRKPNQLSGGQQQRVAVARALAAEPAVIFADEPTANLDSKTGLALIGYMKRLNREKGLTFVFSTHDPRLLEQVRRVVHLEDGRIAYEEERG